MLLLLCGIALLAAFIFIPGTLMAKAFGGSWIDSAALAPVFSTFSYLVLGVMLFQCGVFATWLSMLLPVLVLSVVMYCVSIPLRKKLRTALPSYKNIDIRLLVVALAFNLFIAGIVFLGTLDGADSFNQGFDSAHHLSQVAATVQFGNWSTLNVSMDGTIPGAFYPSVLHIYAALLVGCLGVSTSCAINATIVVFIAVIFPLGVYMLTSVIFPKNRFAPICCALLALTFPGFPWVLLRYCPLWANAVGFALMPLALWTFIRCFEEAIPLRVRIGRCISCLLAMAVISVAHPNTLFSAAVFLFPYCIWQLYARLDLLSCSSAAKAIVKVFAVIAFVGLAGILWKTVHDLEAFRGVVEYSYDAVFSMKEAIIGVVLVKFRWYSAILPLAVLVIIGFLAACKKKDYRWLLLTYVLAALQLVVALSFEPGPFKSMICGFWYNHHFRLAASFALSALPLAGLGLSCICSLCTERFKKQVSGADDIKFARHEKSNAEFPMPNQEPTYSGCVLLGVPVPSVLAIVIVLVLVCFPATYQPEKGIVPRSLGETMAKLVAVNDWDGKKTVYHSEEREFVKQAVAILPEGAYVMNFPYDGSCYAFGLDGLNTFYKSNAAFFDKDSAGYIVLTRLKDIAHDPEVQAAAKELGITHVIQLDHALGKGSSTLEPEYNAEDWTGILYIDQNTEGFEEVLVSGDMRLYKIVYPD